MTDLNTQFETGNIYEMTFISDHELRPHFICSKRTAKTAWFKDINSNERLQRRIKTDMDGNEYIVDGNYSMAPTINSKRVVG